MSDSEDNTQINYMEEVVEAAQVEGVIRTPKGGGSLTETRKIVISEVTMRREEARLDEQLAAEETVGLYTCYKNCTCTGRKINISLLLYSKCV